MQKKRSPDAVAWESGKSKMMFDENVLSGAELEAVECHLVAQGLGL